MNFAKLQMGTIIIYDELIVSRPNPVTLMTEFNRSSTLSVRRPGSALPGTHKSASPASVKTNTAATAAAIAGADRTLASTALLQGRSHVSIVHNGETYQLRATRLGKLILTK